MTTRRDFIKQFSLLVANSANTAQLAETLAAHGAQATVAAVTAPIITTEAVDAFMQSLSGSYFEWQPRNNRSWHIGYIRMQVDKGTPPDTVWMREWIKRMKEENADIQLFDPKEMRALRKQYRAMFSNGYATQIEKTLDDIWPNPDENALHARSWWKDRLEKQFHAMELPDDKFEKWARGRQSVLKRAQTIHERKLAKLETFLDEEIAKAKEIAKETPPTPEPEPTPEINWQDATVTRNLRTDKHTGDVVFCVQVPRGTAPTGGVPYAASAREWSAKTEALAAQLSSQFEGQIQHQNTDYGRGRIMLATPKESTAFNALTARAAQAPAYGWGQRL